ncbi:MAG: hypothetical protein IPL75_08970 [Acidobacteria bacterium]|nr:hypothetical protein [Acidobacteriota bacterium]
MTETQTETQGKIVSIAAFRATRPSDRPMPLLDHLDRPDQFARRLSAARTMPTARSIEHRERMLAFLRKHPASATLTG